MESNERCEDHRRFLVHSGEFDTQIYSELFYIFFNLQDMPDSNNMNQQSQHQVNHITTQQQQQQPHTTQQSNSQDLVNCDLANLESLNCNDSDELLRQLTENTFELESFFSEFPTAEIKVEIWIEIQIKIELNFRTFYF